MIQTDGGLIAIPLTGVKRRQNASKTPVTTNTYYLQNRMKIQVSSSSPQTCTGTD